MTAEREAALSFMNLARVLRAMEFERGLRPAQWDTLRFFATAPQEKQTVTGFALFRRTTMGTASMTVSGLVEKGLLGREDREGGRNRDLHLTPIGYQYLYSDPLNDLAMAVSQLSSEKRTVLKDSLQELHESLSLADFKRNDQDDSANNSES